MLGGKQIFPRIVQTMKTFLIIFAASIAAGIVLHFLKGSLNKQAVPAVDRPNIVPPEIWS